MSDTIEAIRAEVDARLLEIQVKHVLLLMAAGRSQADAIDIVKAASPPVDDIAADIRAIAAALDAERTSKN